MQYKINIQPDAKTDIAGAAEWYDEQRFGLGMELMQRIDEALKQILHQPFGYKKVFMDFRKILTKKFPFFIYYYIDTEKKKIEIVAVIHTSRNPLIWKKRIQK